MILVHLVQHGTPYLADVQTLGSGLVDLGRGFIWHPSIDWSLLAQHFDTDVFAPTRAFFNNFIKSGQLWALLIGLIVGYIIRGLTTYG